MKKSILIVISFVLFVIFIWVLQSAGWHKIATKESASVAVEGLKVYVPQIRFCHGFGFEAGGNHCHWAWEKPHWHDYGVIYYK